MAKTETDTEHRLIGKNGFFNLNYSPSQVTLRDKED
jgi:hypothetical protein